MKHTHLPGDPDAKSPAGADIRHIMAGETGNMIHSTVRPGLVSRATRMNTVSEFWYVLSGRGRLWRREGDGEETVVSTEGVSVDIPVGTAFQYRCEGDLPLKFICITMPPWPGDHEAEFVAGPWQPAVSNSSDEAT